MTKCLERALQYVGDTHSLADIDEGVRCGTMQLWATGDSAIVTEILAPPKRKLLHFFLAGGKKAELESLLPMILAWGKKRGCTHATLIGRPGWARVMRTVGWQVVPAVLMEKEL